MAKGNIGNLLQHFIALHCADRLIRAWNQPDMPVEYIDCYSMAPWEEITGNQPQGFVGMVNRFPEKERQGDFVASTFMAAWRSHHGEEGIPEHPRERDYPNTAVLLRIAFPEQTWNMRLHEDNTAGAGKREELEVWANEQSPGECRVQGDWTDSPLVLNCPAPTDRPTFVMLDPFRIALDDGAASDQPGYLPERLLRFLFGSLALDLASRPERNSAAPTVIALFSYSDSSPNVPDQIVRSRFVDNNWHITRVRSGPWRGRGGECYHQGWIISTGIVEPVIHPSAQTAWDEWCQ